MKDKFLGPIATERSYSKERQHLCYGQSVKQTAALPLYASHVLILWAGLFAAVMCLLPTRACAHVKWFAPADVRENPLTLLDVAGPLFWTSIVLACLALFTASLIEQTMAVQRLGARIEAATQTWFCKIEQIIRVAVGAFFISLWAGSNVLLTPELLTASAWIVWLHFGIAVCMLDRRLLPLGALCILILWSEGVRQYGLFHMIDYVFFPGLALYLALSAAKHPKLQRVGMPLVRILLAFSLMWVSIEKLVYPHWTVYVMQQHPIITLGFEPHVVAQLAGIVEFSLAFSLLWTPIIRRAAALVLAGLMSAAILEFGMIDAIGHIIPIALLIAIALDHSRFPALPYTLSPLLLSGTLGVVFTLYHLAHATV